MYDWIIYVEFEKEKKTYTFGSDEEYRIDDQVIVQTSYGEAIGRVSIPAMPYSEEKAKGELRPVLRLADEQDLQQARENLEREREVLEICSQIIEDLDLEMELIDAQYNLDGSHVLIHYYSKGRVDFRGLLRELTPQIEGRVELKQVSTRPKAKLIGGLGVCGMECCCSRFMTSFRTIPIDMARNQLNSTKNKKILGQCNHLKCCFAFEDEFYTESKKKYPRIGSLVDYQGITYKLINLNIFLEEARLEGVNGSITVPVDQITISPHDKNPKFPRS